MPAKRQATLEKEVIPMMRSMFSAVSGLKGHQLMMDVIGNNIANINTVGYKSSRVSFADLLSQTIRGASLPTASKGGTNPMQIGPGVTVGSIDTIFEGNSLQQTGKSTDLGISGDGLFILADGLQTFYTRNGNFYFDSAGNLVSNLNGMHVQGWLPDPVTGVISTLSAPTHLSINLNSSAPARATSSMVLAGILDSELNNGTLLFQNGTASKQFTVNDGGGHTATLQLTFTTAGPFNTWNWVVTDVSNGSSLGTGTVVLDNDGRVTDSDGDATVTLDGVDFTISPPVGAIPGTDDPSAFTISGAGNIVGLSEVMAFTAPGKNVIQTVYDALGNKYNLELTFNKISVGNWSWEVTSITDSLGNSYAATGGTGSLAFDGTGKISGASTGTVSFAPTGADPVNINFDFSQVTQYAATTTIGVQTQDGYPSGSLTSYSIDTTGTIMGAFSNGVNQALGQIALAWFPNPSGLSREGDSLFSETSNSGIETVAAPGTGNLGTVSPGELEMSNVDLAQEFSNMIIAQRGFEANSKVITASDEMLQTLTSMIR